MNETLLPQYSKRQTQLKPYYLSNSSGIMQIVYNNILIHTILIAKNGYPYIQEDNKGRIKKYVTGRVDNTVNKLNAIYANPEHTHFQVSKKTKISEAEIVTAVADSTKDFITKEKLCSGNFRWQESFAVFSDSKSDIDRVCKYILNQPEHHKKVSFPEEYDKLMSFYQQTLKWEIRK